MADGSLGFADGSSTGAPMRLIVGLGNPGVQYAWTPHNLGFLAVDQIADRAGIRVERPEAKSLVGLGTFAKHDVALAKPQTMMNLSGLAVQDLLRRLECGTESLIVLYDDVALPWGMLRVRERGTAGGHNGLKSVIGALGTIEFARVRMGVQPDHPVADLAGYVLHPMRKAELETAAEMTEQAAEAVELILTQGNGGKAMNRFNRRVSPPDERGHLAPGSLARDAQHANRGNMEERLYDLIFICMPATPEEEISKLIGVLEQAVNEHGGKVEKVEKWGQRKLAYRVAKQREGFYVYMALRSSQGDVIKELERRLRVSDAVIKYMTVRLDEEIKRQQKLVGRRERRARRKARKAPWAAAGPKPRERGPGRHSDAGGGITSGSSEPHGHRSELHNGRRNERRDGKRRMMSEQTLSKDPDRTARRSTIARRTIRPSIGRGRRPAPRQATVFSQEEGVPLLRRTRGPDRL